MYMAYGILPPGGFPFFFTFTTPRLRPQHDSYTAPQSLTDEFRVDIMLTPDE